MTDLVPFAGARALERARPEHLPADPGRLAALVGDGDVARLMAALVRTGLEQSRQ